MLNRVPKGQLLIERRHREMEREVRWKLRRDKRKERRERNRERRQRFMERLAKLGGIFAGQAFGISWIGWIVGAVVAAVGLAIISRIL